MFLRFKHDSELPSNERRLTARLWIRPVSSRVVSGVQHDWGLRFEINSDQIRLDERPTRGMGIGNGPCHGSRIALRHGGLRGDPMLRDRQRAGDISTGITRPTINRFRQNVPNSGPVLGVGLATCLLPGDL
jgi:hypothetical protein